jgi:2-polyprenyl-6-methoxyphenol hydroxylase-like FAD-dependent oxidoreductase
MLGKKGIRVQIVEGAGELDDSPRAAYYGPPAAQVLRLAGVIDDVRKEGHDPKVTCWRKLDGTYLAGFDNSIANDDPDRLANLPLAQLDRLLYKHAIAQSSVEVMFNHKVIDIGQDEEKAWVEVETPEGQKRHEATYVVGCDGATSTVRRKLFGAKDFPGYTWDKQIVATNVRTRSLMTAQSHSHHRRSRTLLKSSVTTMSISSSTQCTGTWLPV